MQHLLTNASAELEQKRDEFLIPHHFQKLIDLEWMKPEFLIEMEEEELTETEKGNKTHSFVIPLPAEPLNAEDSNIWIVKHVFGVAEDEARQIAIQIANNGSGTPVIKWKHNFQSFSKAYLKQAEKEGVTHKPFRFSTFILNRFGITFDDATGLIDKADERRAVFETLPKEQQDEIKAEATDRWQTRYKNEPTIDPSDPTHSAFVKEWWGELDRILIERGIGPKPVIFDENFSREEYEKSVFEASISALESEMDEEHLSAFRQQQTLNAIGSDEVGPNYFGNLYERSRYQALTHEVGQIPKRKESLENALLSDSNTELIRLLTPNKNNLLAATDADLLVLTVEERVNVLEKLSEGPLTQNHLSGNGGEAAVIRVMKTIRKSDLGAMAFELVRGDAKILENLEDRLGGERHSTFLELLTAYMFEAYSPQQMNQMIQEEAFYYIHQDGMAENHEDPEMEVFQVLSETGFKLASKAILYDVTWDRGMINVHWEKRIAGGDEGTVLLEEDDVPIGPFEPVKIRFIDANNPYGFEAGTEIIAPGMMLFAIEDYQWDKYAAEYVEIVLLAAGVGEIAGAATMFRKVLGAVDLLVGAAGVTINGNREAIRNLEGGKEFLENWDVFQQFIGYYGVTRVVAELPMVAYNMRKSWKNVGDKDTLPDEVIADVDESIKEIDDYVKANKNVEGNAVSAKVGRLGENRFGVEEVPIDNVQRLHGTPKKGTPPNHVENMAEEIDIYGYNLEMSPPIEGVRMPDGRVLIFDGHHRVEALTSLGETSIPMKITNYTDVPDESMRLMLKIGEDSGYYIPSQYPEGYLIPDLGISYNYNIDKQAKEFLENNF